MTQLPLQTFPHDLVYNSQYLHKTIQSEVNPMAADRSHHTGVAGNGPDRRAHEVSPQAQTAVLQEGYTDAQNSHNFYQEPFYPRYRMEQPYYQNNLSNREDRCQNTAPSLQQQTFDNSFSTFLPAQMPRTPKIGYFPEFRPMNNYQMRTPNGLEGKRGISGRPEHTIDPCLLPTETATGLEQLSSHYGAPVTPCQEQAAISISQAQQNMGGGQHSIQVQNQTYYQSNKPPALQKSTGVQEHYTPVSRKHASKGRKLVEKAKVGSDNDFGGLRGDQDGFKPGLNNQSFTPNHRGPATLSNAPLGDFSISGISTGNLSTYAEFGHASPQFSVPPAMGPGRYMNMFQSEPSYMESQMFDPQMFDPQMFAPQMLDPQMLHRGGFLDMGQPLPQSSEFQMTQDFTNYHLASPPLNGYYSTIPNSARLRAALIQSTNPGNANLAPENSNLDVRIPAFKSASRKGKNGASNDGQTEKKAKRIPWWKRLESRYPRVPMTLQELKAIDPDYEKNPRRAFQDMNGEENRMKAFQISWDQMELLNA
ncbi:hypothetical protein NHQ30_009449 [Ciborinia camelliae]|nr:hypothetical protein NHQ30_009449 [Ciborinia camelliae]